MVRESFIGLGIAFKYLLCPPFHPSVERDVSGCFIPITTLQHEETLIVSNHLTVNRIDSTSAEGEKIDGIEHICLSRSVVSYKAVEFRRELQRGSSDIPVVEDGKVLKNHYQSPMVNAATTAMKRRMEMTMRVKKRNFINFFFLSMARRLLCLNLLAPSI